MKAKVIADISSFTARVAQKDPTFNTLRGRTCENLERLFAILNNLAPDPEQRQLEFQGILFIRQPARYRKQNFDWTFHPSSIEAIGKALGIQGIVVKLPAPEATHIRLNSNTQPFANNEPALKQFYKEVGDPSLTSSTTAKVGETIVMLKQIGPSRVWVCEAVDLPNIIKRYNLRPILDNLSTLQDDEFSLTNNSETLAQWPGTTADLVERFEKLLGNPRRSFTDCVSKGEITFNIRSHGPTRFYSCKKCDELAAAKLIGVILLETIHDDEFAISDADETMVAIAGSIKKAQALAHYLTTKAGGRLEALEENVIVDGITLNLRLRNEKQRRRVFAANEAQIPAIQSLKTHLEGKKGKFRDKIRRELPILTQKQLRSLRLLKEYLIKLRTDGKFTGNMTLHSIAQIIEYDFDNNSATLDQSIDPAFLKRLMLMIASRFFENGSPETLTSVCKATKELDQILANSPSYNFLMEDIEQWRKGKSLEELHLKLVELVSDLNNPHLKERLEWFYTQAPEEIIALINQARSIQLDPTEALYIVDGSGSAFRFDDARWRTQL